MTGWRWTAPVGFTVAQRAEIEAAADAALVLAEPVHAAEAGVWALSDVALRGWADVGAISAAMARDVTPALVSADGRGVHLVRFPAETGRAPGSHRAARRHRRRRRP